MNQKPKIVIVIPAYNEEQSIHNVIVSCHNEGYQSIIVVDDGSTDNTAQEAQQAGAIVVSHMINRGVGGATQTGLQAARKLGADIVVTMDADGQHQAHDIKRLVGDVLNRQTDIIIGSRFLNKNNAIPLSRKLYNNIANIITFFLSGIYLTDSQSGLKAFSKPALQKINISSNGFEFCSEIIREVRHFGFSIKETPISVVYSSYSLSKGQSLSSGLTTVFKLVIKTLMR